MIQDEFLDNLVMMGVVLSFMSLCIFTEFFSSSKELSEKEDRYREENLKLQRAILEELKKINNM